MSPYVAHNGAAIEFTGDHSVITSAELDRRALDDPKFLITENIPADQLEDDPLRGEVTFRYNDALKGYTGTVLFHAALVEANVNGNRNVVRKLLWGSGGRAEARTWTQGTQLTLPINYAIDVPVTDPDGLYLVTFVQDKDTREIFQSSIVKLPRKIGRMPVGVEVNPFLAEIGDIHVFPNPASKEVNFALENPLMHDYTFRIIDQRGVTIVEGALDHDLRIPQRVDLTVLSNGIYFVQFRNADNKVVTHRQLAVMNRQ
jgi:hypothetical protein